MVASRIASEACGNGGMVLLVVATLLMLAPMEPLAPGEQGGDAGDLAEVPINSREMCMLRLLWLL